MEISLGFQVISGLPRTYSNTNNSGRRRRAPPSTNKPLVPLLNRPKPKPTRPPQQFPCKKQQESNDTISTSSSTSLAPADILRMMDSLQLPISEDMYACLLKECTDSTSPLVAANLHAHINNSASFRPGIHLQNRILLMYAACGCTAEAHQLFGKMHVRDVISWAIIIMLNIEGNNQEEALNLFTQMNEQGLKPTVLILVHILKACSSSGAFGLGKQIHGWALKMGTLMNGRDLFLGSSLVDFYGKSGCLESARRVFDQMHHQDTVAWTSMIVGYGREDGFEEALQVFKEMCRTGKRKNNFTLSSALRVCGRIGGNGQQGKQIHANAIKAGVESDLFVGSSLIDMYGKCGLLRDARQVFDIMSERNDVCWNAMLNAYAQQGCCVEAVKFLYKMKAAGMEPQESMLNEVRIACGS